MKKANISKIKAELSKFIRFARQGEEVIILDRNQAVAKIVAMPPEVSAVPIRAAQSDLKAVLKHADRRSFDEASDILDVLLEDREDRF